MSIIRDNQGNPFDSTNPLPVTTIDSNVITPIDIQSHYATTIQTHNAVSIALSGVSDSTWIDCDGFDRIAITVMSDAATSNKVHVFWSNDGTTIQGLDYDAIPTSSQQQRAGEVITKARYAKIRLNNLDSALAHTMSAWVYLKA